ncbi:hypothetical protein ACIQC5_11540 [Paenarthrobacter sp. NPDC092416]
MGFASVVIGIEGFTVAILPESGGIRSGRAQPSTISPSNIWEQPV